MADSKVQSEDFEFLDRVGSGYSGKVFRARQKSLGRDVAIKIIKTEYNVADALSHARPLAKANHPAVVTIYDVRDVTVPGVNRKEPAIIMEWLDGEGFEVRLRRPDFFSIEQASTICNDLIDGIEHLHSIGQCHLDLHAANLIILPNGRAKIIDIDANKKGSLSQLSNRSQVNNKQEDVAYCCGIIFSAFRHSCMDLGVVIEMEHRLKTATSIGELREIISIAADSAIAFKPGKTEWLSDVAMPDVPEEKVIEVLDTSCYFKLSGERHPTINETMIVLAANGLIRKSGNGWSILNIGAILLGESLKDFDVSLSRKAIRFIMYDGVSKIQTKYEREVPMGYASGFEEIIDFVHSVAPQNVHLEEAIRKEVKMFPKQAIRELVANAMVHQDYECTGTSILIEMYDDRLEISNPGVPELEVDRFIDDNVSRNEHLATLMRSLGMCEEKGSGVDKVISLAELYQLPPPDFRIKNVNTTAVLFAHTDFSVMSKADRVRACYQHCVLEYLNNRSMSNQSLRNRFGLEESKSATVSTILQATKELGRIKQVENESASTRYARYIPYWA